MRHHLTFDLAPHAFCLREPRACCSAFSTDLVLHDAQHGQEGVR